MKLRAQDLCRLRRNFGCFLCVGTSALGKAPDTSPATADTNIALTKQSPAGQENTSIWLKINTEPKLSGRKNEVERLNYGNIPIQSWEITLVSATLSSLIEMMAKNTKIRPKLK